MSLASLKRRLTPGTVVYLRECLTGRVAAVDALREVRENQPSFVAFNAYPQGAAAKVSYLYWPSAAEVKETADGFAVYEGARLCARYTWQAPAPGETAAGRPGSWAIGTNAPELAAACRAMAERNADPVERAHAEAVLGERFSWAVTPENLAAFIAATKEL